MTNEHEGLSQPIRHGYAQVGDVRLHYAECGEGERLVLLLHGFPECWYSWRRQLPALGERYHVVAPDMRGYNLSDKPSRVEDYKINLLVDDVLGLIRHFGAREAAVVGHDWGAAVAWAVAQHYPDYVWKLASLQVPPPAVTGFAGGRPKVEEIVAYWPALIPKTEITPRVQVSEA